MNHPDQEKSDTTLGFKLSPKSIAKFEFAWKVAVALMLLLGIFLKTQYVSISDYKLDRDKEAARRADDDSDRKQMQSAIVELKTLVATMEVKNQINQRQDFILQDHESRMRA